MLRGSRSSPREVFTRDPRNRSNAFSYCTTMTTRIESRTLNATVRDPRLEAQRVVGPGFAARVLEPSPPAILDGEWLADDPTVGDEPTPEQPVLSPAPGRGHTWEEWLRGHPDQGGWAGARWLAGYRRLSSPPSALPQTRLALHRLAVYVVSPARRHANGKIGLRWTLGGFGTPFFGPDEQVRVDGTWIVRQQSDRASAERITSLAKAASFRARRTTGRGLGQRLRRPEHGRSR